jgi:hypothetical protein
MDAGEVWYDRLIPSRHIHSYSLSAVTRIPALLPPYHRSLRDYENMVETLRPHSISFEDSRALLARWVAQEWLEEDGWEARWEDLCAVEVDGWD